MGREKSFIKQYAGFNHRLPNIMTLAAVVLLVLLELVTNASQGVAKGMGLLLGGHL